MREINNPEEALRLCKALGSPIRMGIIKILKQNRSVNINTLSEQLGVTNGAMTAHIKMLCDEGIIAVEHAPGKRGVQKNCVLKEHKFIMDLSREYNPDNVYETDIPIGSYTSHSIYPTCGLATRSQVIGHMDDPRYFNDPQRTEAAILWFTKGFVEYPIPNYLKPNSRVVEIQLSMELSSEAPGVCEDWPSEIHFELNTVPLGSWISPGDFGKVRGLYTPDWWHPHCNQYGMLKLLTVNEEGSFVDGRKISDITINRLNLHENSEMKFRLSVSDDEGNIGGLTLFGKGFGNYNQNINVRVLYQENEPVGAEY